MAKCGSISGSTLLGNGKAHKIRDIQINFVEDEIQPSLAPGSWLCSAYTNRTRYLKLSQISTERASPLGYLRQDTK